MNRKSSTRTSLGYQKLEQRQMLASITFDSGELVIRGDATDDLIELVGSADFQSFTVAINSDPSLTETFQYADVTGLTVFAGDGNDRVNNTLLRDTIIDGGNGDDRIEGGFRNDRLTGGAGVDTLIGRHGNDVLEGQAGRDSLFGSPGVDQLVGGDDDDRLFGGEGDDLLRGEDGDDLLIGDNGDDVLIGGLGDDRFNGGAGDDLLNGNEGNDRITAGAGDDTVNGGRGEDTIFGSSGLNTLNGNGDNDIINGGTDRDIIRGGSEDDRLAGNQGDDELEGGTGDDELFGGLGDDGLQGDAGEDLLSGQQGDDVLFGGDGVDSVFGNDGDDTFFVDLGDERLNGNDGFDRVQLFRNDRFNFDVERSGANFTLTNVAFFEEGTTSDVLISIEEIDFLGDVGPPSEFVAPPIVERIVVQPIVVSDDDGSNTATSLGTPAEQAAIQAVVDRIFNQAGIAVEFLPTNSYNSTFANAAQDDVENEVSRFSQIISAGDAAGVGSSDPTVVDLYFTTQTPGQGTPVFSAGGRGFIGRSGVIVSVAPRESTSFLRDRIAELIAHEIGHNLGLEHTDGIDTLLTPGIPNRLLTQDQIDISLASNISRPV